MQLVIEGLFALGLVLLGLWLWSLRSSLSKDRQTQQQRAQEERTVREREARDARLRRKGEPLRCLNCDRTFRGPMAETGCPSCHLTALVVTEAEYRQGRRSGKAGPPHNGKQNRN